MSAKTARRVKARRRSRPWKRRLKIAGLTVFIVFGIPALILGFMFMGEYSRAKDLLDKVSQNIVDMGGQKPSLILSADNKVLYRVATEYREPIESIDDVPQLVRNATIAAEDKRFYKHGGVDYWALLRMLFTNVREGRLAQGGSTIEMQLAKRLASNSEHTFRRKLQDVALAFRMEKAFTKDQILLLYLNQVYYGSGAFGIKAAANVYFGKRLDQLTVSDAALLARLVRRPSKENPFDDLETSLQNRDVVLGIMRDEGMIDEAAYDKAKREKPHLRKRFSGSGAVVFGSPYFVQYVLDFVKREAPEIDLETGGYQIHTTLNAQIQDIAEREVRKVVSDNRRRRVTTAAFVLMDADGRLLAMVGGVDFKRNQYNVVTQGHRQPGSAFKPFVYATALNNGVIGPNDTISNDRFYYDDGYGNRKEIRNSGGSYGGVRSVESAIAGSVNVCAARVMEKTGPPAVVETAHSVFGFKSKLDPYLSLALGSSEVTPLEMAQGYSVFMLKGDRATPFGVTKIVGPDGRTVRNFEPTITRNVLSREVCDYMDRFLRAVVTHGTAAHYQRAMPPNSRGKTGTTSENKDAWFCGYTDNLVGIGWVGNEHYDKSEDRWVYDPMSSDTFGGTVTVKIWAGVLKRAAEIYGSGPPRSESHDRDLAVDGAAGKLVDPRAPAPDGTLPAAGTTRPDGTTPAPGSTEVGPKPIDVPPTSPTGPQSTGPPPARQPRDPSPPVRRPATSQDTQYVEVEVCADTGLRATMYCPETVVRRFRKGHEPRKRCTLHSPTR